MSLHMLVAMVILLVFQWEFVGAVSRPSTAYLAFISKTDNSQEKKAVESAIQQVNSDPALLAGTTLKLVNTMYTDSDSLGYAVNLSSHGTLAMFLDYYPSPSQELLSALLNIPLVTTNPGHGTVKPVNSTKVQRGLSLAAGRGDVIQAILGVMQHFKWTSVLALFDVRWVDQVADFLSLLPSDIEKHILEMVLDQKGKLFEETKSRLQELNNRLVEVIVLFCDAEFLTVVMEEVHCSCSRGVERAHNWILVDMLPSFDMRVQKHQIVMAFSPSIATNQHTYRLITDLSANRTSIRNSSYLLYDSVLTFAHALDKVISSGRWVSYSPIYNVEESRNGMNILKDMKKVNIVGSTGRIRFDSTGIREGMALDIMNLRSNTFVKIGSWSSAGGRQINLRGEAESNEISAEVIPLSRLNRKFKVVVVEDPPFVMATIDKKTGKRKLEGYSVDLIQEIAQLLSFRFQIYESPDGKYGGRKKDGSYNGIVGQVISGKGDLSTSPLTINSDRARYLAFSKPVMQFTMDLVFMKPPTKKPDILAFMMPYSIPVWLMTLACLAFVTGMLSIVNFFSPFGHRLGENGGTGVEFNLFNSLWFSLASMLQQGGDNTPKCLSGRVLVGCFWFCVLIWVSTYTANLAAFFSYQPVAHTVGSLSEVLEDGHKLYIVADTALHELFKVSKFDTYAKLYRRMETEKLFVNNTSQGFDKIRRDKNAIFMDENPFAEYFISLKPCDLSTAKGFMGASNYGIAMAKDSPYADNISVAVLKLKETGVLEELRRKWWDYRSQCPKGGAKSQTERLALENMAGVYIVLVAGCFVGMLTVLGEKWWSKKGEQVKKNFKRVMPAKLRGKNSAKVEGIDGGI